MSLAQGLLLLVKGAATGKEGKSQSLFALRRCSSLVVLGKFSCLCSETRSWFYTEIRNYLSSRALDILHLIFIFTSLFFFGVQVTRSVEIPF